MNYYTGVIKKYADFSGRARRKEYWMFALITFVISFILGIVDELAGFKLSVSGQEIGILTLIYSLFILIPSLAVSVRRLHDIEKSGWWLLIELIPLVGSIIVFVFTCMAGTVGPNKYGDDPKAIAE